jgi:N6-adenosine-specific RNA methylase IME4
LIGIERFIGCGFTTIVADPPWSYRDKVHAARSRKLNNLIGYGADKIRGRRGAAGYYSTMTIDEIKALPVSKCAATNSHLYLWVTNAFVDEAFTIARDWGFEPRTMLTWVKPGIGMGHYFRNNTEHVVFAVRGSLRCKLRNQPTSFTAPKSKLHSQKPERFFEIVESMSPGPYLELFARGYRDGWMSWGNEV